MMDRYWQETGAFKRFTTPLDFSLIRQRLSLEAKLLDIGCGYGRALSLLSQEGYCNLWGCDISLPLLKRGKEEELLANVAVASATDLPFPDGLFDGAFLMGVLTAVPFDEDQRRVACEVLRVLKPGGTLYLTDFLINRDPRNLERYRVGWKWGSYGIFSTDGGLFRHHDQEYIRSLFDKFNPLHWEEVTLETMNGHLSQGFIMMGEKGGE